LLAGKVSSNGIAGGDGFSFQRGAVGAFGAGTGGPSWVVQLQLQPPTQRSTKTAATRVLGMELL
jgi:homoaconitase/3-isopropylmalate dehydratase large subunit